MKPIYTAIFIFFLFASGVYVGANITFKAIRDVEVSYPTKGEGYKSSQRTEQKYSEQTRKLGN